MRRVNLGLSLLVALILVGCAEQSATTKSIRKVKSEVVEVRSDHSAATTYPAKLYAAKESNASFRVAGVIESIEVREGQQVKAGEVIARLDPRDYEVQLAATTAEYNAITAEANRVIALHAEQSVTDNDFDKATNGKRQIEAKLQAHTNALDDTQLKAPYGGYVQSINFEQGETVGAGMPIINIVSDQSPEVVVNISASDYVRRKKLIAAEATIDLYPGVKFTLKPLGTTHKANLNQLYEARFRIVRSGDKAQRKEVKPTAGMSAMVELRYPTADDGAVEVDFNSIVDRDGVTSLWLVDGGKATLREVEVLSVTSRGRAIVTGVEPGDEVITAGVNSLKEGMKVESQPKPSPSNVGNIL